MTGFVLDVSLAMGWFFEDEMTDQGWRLLDKALQEGVAVPSIWTYELANVLALAERRGRTTAAKSAVFLQMLDGMRIEVEAMSSRHLFDAVLPLARASGLTAYDAAYVDLAQRLHRPLATKDRRMAAAAAGLGVTLLPTA